MKPEEVASQLDMSVEQLRAVNNIPPRMVIKAGSTLLVHRKGRLDSDVAAHLADNGQLGLAPEVVLRRISVKARKGDSLASLAARHGVSATNMAAWNKLKANSPVAAGQTLTILVPSEGARRVARSTTRKASAPKKASSSKSASQKQSKSNKKKP
jgi:membrane-bound lytic murein transglycosylase D